MGLHLCRIRVIAVTNPSSTFRGVALARTGPNGDQAYAAARTPEKPLRGRRCYYKVPNNLFNCFFGITTRGQSDPRHHKLQEDKRLHLDKPLWQIYNLSQRLQHLHRTQGTFRTI